MDSPGSPSQPSPATSSQPVSDPGDRVSNTGDWQAVVAALVAGFGVGTLVITPLPAIGIWVAAIALGGGVMLGRACASQSLVAVAGVCIGLTAWTIAAMGLAPPVPSESAWLDAVPVILVPILAVVATAGLLLGIFVARRARPTRLPGRLVVTGGLVAVAAYGLTLGVLAYAPSSASFEIPLPEGWHPIPREEVRWTYDIQLGDAFTAVFGPREGRSLTSMPVIGVTVVRDARTASSRSAPATQCYFSMDTWGRSATPLYDGERVSPPMTVELPVGTAHAEVLAVPDQPATIVYGFGIARARLVGALPEESCYILAITVPSDGPITESDARSIAESFRFR